MILEEVLEELYKTLSTKRRRGVSRSRAHRFFFISPSLQTRCMAYGSAERIKKLNQPFLVITKHCKALFVLSLSFLHNAPLQVRPYSSIRFLVIPLI